MQPVSHLANQLERQPIVKGSIFLPLSDNTRVSAAERLVKILGAAQITPLLCRLLMLLRQHVWYTTLLYKGVTSAQPCTMLGDSPRLNQGSILGFPPLRPVALVAFSLLQCGVILDLG